MFSSSSEGIVSLVDALGVYWSVEMSRVQASSSPYCSGARQPGPDGRCVIISKATGERLDQRIICPPVKYMQEQIESGMAAGLGSPVSFKTGSSRILWKAKPAGIMAVSED
jgi:hypothetical protein